jgi:hypothetical protein
MRPIVRVLVAVLLAALGCDVPTPPPTLGGLTLQVTTVPGSVAILDSGRILIRGQVSRDIVTTPGRTETITGLPEGPYTVALEGFRFDAVYYFGQTSAPVTVVGGQNKTADIPSFLPFTPSAPTFSDTFWIGKSVPVSFGSVGASSYTVEWSEDQTFSSGVTSSSTSSTSTQIAVANFAVYWVRVRATDPYQHPSAFGPAARIRSVKFGPTKRLRFTRQPTATVAGATITPAVEVIAQDSLGDTAAVFAGSVTIAIAANPKNGTLGGTRTVAASSGVATFSTLKIDSVATGYTLWASASGLAPDTSSAFSITTPPADLRIAASPALVVTPGRVSQGDTVAVSSFIVVNQGNGPSNAADVGFYLSPDSTITAADTRLGGLSIPVLGPAKADTVGSQIVPIPLPVAPGTYYLGALVDDSGKTAESDEANNFESAAFAVRILFQVTSLQPPDGAGNVETGVVVEAQFSDGPDPTSVDINFTVSQGGTQLVSLINNYVSTRTARLSAPFLPGTAYLASLPKAILDTSGRPLASARQVSFTTRSWQPLTVGPGGQRPAMVISPGGRIHVIHGSGNDVLYSTCASNCTSLSGWQTTTILPLAGGAALALDSAGGLHVSYRDSLTKALKYATCVNNCTTPAAWTKVLVDPTDVDFDGTSIAVTLTGRVHVAYRGRGTGALQYVTCYGSCTDALAWAATVADSASSYYPSIAVDQSGQPHVVAYAALTGDLRYSTCSNINNCYISANWQTIAVDKTLGDVGFGTSIAVEPSGRLDVAYYNISLTTLKFATCTNGCLTLGSWEVGTADSDPTGDVGWYPSLALDALNRMFVSYYDGAPHAYLKFASCAVACTATGSWRHAPVDLTTNAGLQSSIRVDATGRVHIAYRGAAGGLSYME